MKLIETAKWRVRAAKPQATGHALTVVIAIAPGREDALRALLEEISTHVRGNAFIPFEALQLVHFMRWVIVPAASPSSRSLLAFESNYDGELDAHVMELVSEGAAGIHAVYQHCEGYPVRGDVLPPEQRAAVSRFLIDHAIPYRAFYVAVPGASARQIKGEGLIRQRIELALTNLDPSGEGRNADPISLCRALAEPIRLDPALKLFIEQADDATPLRPLRLAAAALGAAAAVPALLPALAGIAVKEHFDEEIEQLDIPDEARQLMAREDLQIQNQLTHVVSLRPGPLRALSTRVVLAAIDFLAHEIFTRGSLGNISSIHFARWVLIDKGRRLLFFSNYDGSWEKYLGDFIDKAAVGLTSVWSNTEGFPKTVLLAFKGATDEERFKAWTRAHQIPTQVWYSAYPRLTVPNILNNRKICAQLRRGFHTEHEARAWLKRF